MEDKMKNIFIKFLVFCFIVFLSGCGGGGGGGGGSSAQSTPSSSSDQNSISVEEGDSSSMIPSLIRIELAVVFPEDTEVPIASINGTFSKEKGAKEGVHGEANNDRINFIATSSFDDILSGKTYEVFFTAGGRDSFSVGEFDLTDIHSDIQVIRDFRENPAKTTVTPIDKNAPEVNLEVTVEFPKDADMSWVTGAFVLDENAEFKSMLLGRNTMAYIPSGDDGNFMMNVVVANFGNLRAGKKYEIYLTAMSDQVLVGKVDLTNVKTSSDLKCYLESYLDRSGVHADNLCQFLPD